MISTSVCLSACMPQKSHAKTSQNFLYMLAMAVAQSSDENA